MDHVVADTGSVRPASLFARETCLGSCPPVGKCDLKCDAGKSCQLAPAQFNANDANCIEVCPKNFCGVDVSPVATTVPSSNGNGSTGGGPSVGPIAGGVAGGIVAIAIVTYLVWRFCIKGKRQPLDQEAWSEEKDGATVNGGQDFVSRRDQRSSMHTVHSVASTVLTRASNVIQIAYIPGVTNRATPTSPTLLVPPVPPIPISVSQASSPAATEDQHFFMPSDLRPDSTYSAVSGYTDRTSYARTSYAPRSSIASTIYGKNAIIVAPAQTGMRAKPAMVSVKSTMSSSSSSGSNTPPVPNIDFEKYSAGVARPPSPANSTFSVGSTFLNNASASTAMAARPQLVRVGSTAKKPGSSLATSVSAGESTSASASPLLSSPLSPDPRSSAAVTLIEDSPHPDQGPFADPPKSSQNSNKSLNAVIEEATRRASARDTAKTDRGRSPFGDEHVTRD